MKKSICSRFGDSDQVASYEMTDKDTGLSVWVQCGIDPAKEKEKEAEARRKLSSMIARCDSTIDHLGAIRKIAARIEAVRGDYEFPFRAQWAEAVLRTAKIDWSSERIESIEFSSKNIIEHSGEGSETLLIDLVIRSLTGENTREKRYEQRVDWRNKQDHNGQMYGAIFA